MYDSMCWGFSTTSGFVVICLTDPLKLEMFVEHIDKNGMFFHKVYWEDQAEICYAQLRTKMDQRNGFVFI